MARSSSSSPDATTGSSMAASAPCLRPPLPSHSPRQMRPLYLTPQLRYQTPPLPVRGGSVFFPVEPSCPPPPPPLYDISAYPRLPSNLIVYCPPYFGKRTPRRRDGGGRGQRLPSPSVIAERFRGLGFSGSDASRSGSARGSGGINFDAYEDIPVEVSGEDVPRPVSTFAEIDLGETLSLNLQRCRYVKPTPVQRNAIPILLAGRDLMACAQTGSGKTAAFCFPILRGVMRRSAPPLQCPPRGAPVAFPRALILSPTRELSSQIHNEAKKFGYQTGVRIVVAYGGAPIYSQLRELERSVEILVATPGRLLDLLERGRVSLQEIKYLALDEADRMLDMGFEPQIRKIVQQMDMPPPGRRQTMLFSATFPTEIQQLASEFLSNYVFLAVGRVGSSIDLISQRVEYVPEMDKRGHLMNLLRTRREIANHGKQALTLVFVETKRAADSLESWLSRSGFRAVSIHGDKTQVDREHALRTFKSGVIPILVATDVAARGLDIPHVTHVINYDLPRDIDTYVHRIGRTGRAGKAGLTTAFFSEGNQPLARVLAECMDESKQEVPDWLRNYAAMPSCGGKRNRQYGEGKFGGHDYRTEPSGEGHYSNAYGGESGNGSHNSYDFQSYCANAYGGECSKATADNRRFQNCTYVQGINATNDNHGSQGFGANTCEEVYSPIGGNHGFQSYCVTTFGEGINAPGANKYGEGSSVTGANIYEGNLYLEMSDSQALAGGSNANEENNYAGSEVHNASEKNQDVQSHELQSFGASKNGGSTGTSDDFASFQSYGLGLEGIVASGWD